jgi:non-specific protein-tyrosine kinase
LELKHYFILARRWWWLLILLTALGGAASFGFTTLSEPTYEATTTLLINQAPGALPDANAVYNGQVVAVTYAELMRQRPVMEAVIKNLGLAMDGDSLKGEISVTPVRDTNLLVVSVQDTDPYRAASIANEVVKVFIQQNVEFQSSRYSDSIASLQEEMDALQADINETESELAALEGKSSADNVAERNRLQQILTQSRSSYALLVQSFEEIRLAEAQTTDTITVVETAVPGRSLTNPVFNTIIGVLLGAMLAVGLVLLIEYLRETVKSEAEIEQLAGVPALGVIGHIRANGHGTLITATKPRSPIAEAYRMLRTNVDFAALDDSIRSVVITSSGPAEGKSTTAANLAIAVAQSGKRVILIDADLRRPSQHKLFAQLNQRGLTTALQVEGSDRMADHLSETGIENLYLMTSGPLPPNPTDLLGSWRMSHMVEVLKRQVDFVVIDTPPVLAVADSSLLARLCDGVLLVVLADTTRTNALRRATEQIQQAGARLLGVVLNKVTATSGGYYYSANYYTQEN